MATWVIGDVHGYYYTFLDLIEKLDLAEQDRVILIGDVVDRGPHTPEMLDWVMENVKSGSQFFMLLGNHEWMIADAYERAMEQILVDSLKFFNKECEYGFVKYMGQAGFRTMKDFEPIVEFFKKLPLCVKVATKTTEFVLVHAWCQKKIKNEQPLTLLWGREIDEWGQITNYPKDHGNILVHGHTPTLMEDMHWAGAKPGKVWFRGQSINVDCGCCYVGKDDRARLAALRLEDMKVVYADPHREWAAQLIN